MLFILGGLGGPGRGQPLPLPGTGKPENALFWSDFSDNSPSPLCFRPICLASRRPPIQSAAASASIRRTIAPNNRRVRCRSWWALTPKKLGSSKLLCVSYLGKRYPKLNP